ncbi:arsenate reductase [Christiangramia gaetbulicola]|uniref:Arsenate reductase n=1 Tax=Christiangramia gaetbulicola TaxID=703340 RepID=A0A2T6AGJ5_9FLAO|nr:arsenate reductase (glutaredoxin) [Christiangramia gaetbulicola]PTX42912.1 arsenate reductase [Christiangramia gaetbulicola]
MLRIYHNARCKKSREGLEILKNSGKDFEIKEYLKEPLNEEELEKLIKKLDITPIQLVRKNEKVWKEDYKDKDLSDRELITVMVKNPKLIERPVVETEKQAVIGRPPSNIEKLL